jgi:uncharacterized protein (TIGR03086 family)
MDMVEMYARALARAESIVAGTRRDQFADPTPCEDWDVETLVDHMIGGCLTMASAGTGEASNALNERGNYSGDHVEAFREAAAGALATFRAPGALDRTLQMPWGETPATSALSLALADAVIHSWDLATATGQEWDVDDDIAETVYGWTIKMMEPQGKMPRMSSFKAPVEVSDSAPVAEKMLAYLGRRP